MTFVCASCGQQHDLEEISIGAREPHLWTMLTPEEKSASELRAETCVVKSATGTLHHFILGCLNVPIKNSALAFTWGVWVSLSERSYTDILTQWNNPDRAQLPSHGGWLSTRLPDYPETLNQKVRIVQRAVGLRPLIELEPQSLHPLAVHQREGIESTAMQRIVERALHA